MLRRFTVELARSPDPQACLPLALEGALALCAGRWALLCVDGGVVRSPGADAPPELHAWLERVLGAVLADAQGKLEGVGELTALGVPLCADGRVVGALAVLGTDARPTTLARLEEWAQVVAALYTRATAHASAQVTAQRRRNAQAVTARALSQPDPDEALRALVSGHAEIFGGRGGIRFLNADTGLLEWNADALSAKDNPLEPALRIGEGVIGWVAERGEGVLVTDYPTWPGALALYVDQGIKSVIAAPLKRAGAVIGVVFAESLSDAHAYTTADLEILEHAATLAGTMLEQVEARVHSEAARREAERGRAMLEAIHEANVALLGSEADLQTLLQRLLERSVGLLDADIGGVYMVEGDEVALKATLGDDLLPRAPLGYGVSGGVAMRGAAVVLEDYAASPYHDDAHPGVSWRGHQRAPERQHWVHRH